jgi:hypothetical protein
MILDSSVGHAGVSRWRRVRVGATTQQATACKAEQQPRARRQRLNRACSALTQMVDLVEVKIFNVHADLLMKSSGQLRNLG